MTGMFIPPADAPQWSALQRLLDHTAELLAMDEVGRVSSTWFEEGAEVVCDMAGITNPTIVRWVARRATYLFARSYLDSPHARGWVIDLIVDHCGEELTTHALVF